MSKKYVDPEILKSRFMNGCDDYLPLWKIEMVIDDAPAADVEEVRRCKDCRYWGEGLTEEEKDEVRKLPMADLVCGWWSSDGCCPNDFCSNAKPKHRR